MQVVRCRVQVVGCRVQGAGGRVSTPLAQSKPPPTLFASQISPFVFAVLLRDNTPGLLHAIYPRPGTKSSIRRTAVRLCDLLYRVTQYKNIGPTDISTGFSVDIAFEVFSVDSERE